MRGVEVQALGRRADARGELLRVFPDGAPGEVYAVTVRPGASRGHHLHPRGGEWFAGLGGEPILVAEDPHTGERVEIALAGVRARVEAGVAHAIFARGDREALVLAATDLPHDELGTVPHPVAPPGGRRGS